MAKPKRLYVCNACGAQQRRWQGQCPDCGEWNTLVEDVPVTTFSQKHDLSGGGRALTLEALTGALRNLTGRWAADWLRDRSA
jgi:DNA repair protein RadA/Sms